MTEKQRSWYQTAAEFYGNEMATLGWRTNIFIVAQSILVGNFILLQVNRSRFISWAASNAFLVFAIGIALVGLLYCIVHYLSGKSAATAAEFWRAYICELEAPNKTENNPWVCGPWHALCKYYRREESQELRWFEVCKQSEEQNCQTSKTEQSKRGKSKTSQDKQFKAPPLYERKLLCIKPGPASWFILPAIFGLAWLIAVGLVLWVTELLWPWVLCLIVIALFSVLAALNKPQRLWRPTQEVLIWVLRQFNT